MVEGERPAADISATQLRTAALVILTSGVVPNLGNTCTFSVISSRCAGGQPEVVPGLDPVGGPLLESDLTATGIAP